MLSGWNSNNIYKIVIDHTKIDNDLTHFPVTVVLDSSQSDIFDELAYGSIDDDFTGTDGDPPNSTRWKTVETTNGTVQIYNNQLKLAASSSASNEYPNAQCRVNFPADFDVQIDFTDVSIVDDGDGPELFCSFNTGSDDFFIKVTKNGGSKSFEWRFQVAGTKYINHVSRTNDYGKLRLIRSGSAFTIKYIDGNGSWQTAGSRTDLPSSAPYVRTGLWHGPNSNATYGIFDNFQVNTGTTDGYSWLHGHHPNVKKIAFTKGDGTTQIYADIDYYNDYTKKAIFHVSSPSLTISSTIDTILYFYYDSSHADNTSYIGYAGESAAQNVWDSNFKGVWHLSYEPDISSLYDATSNGNNGSQSGGVSRIDQSEGACGLEVALDGSDDYLDFGASNSFNITQYLTLELLVKPTTGWGASSRTEWLLQRQHMPVLNQDTWAMFINSDGELQLGSYGGNIQSTKNSWSAGSTFYIAGTYDYTGPSGDLFIDGIKETLSTDNYDLMAGATGQNVIAGTTGADYYAEAVYDEIRISDTVRSDAWIKATNYSLRNNLLEVSKVSTIYYFSGDVSELSTAISGAQIYIYNQSDGSLIGSTTSSGDGGFYLTTTYSGAHFLVCVDPAGGEDYNNLIYGDMYPITISG